MHLNDRELIARLKQESRKESAFYMLVNKYQERLYWHIRKIVLYHEDADDVLQNTFIKVWRNVDSFREESSLFTWLYRIATNESITYINERKRKKHLSLTGESEFIIENLASDPYFDGDEIQLKLQEAIYRLPEKQRIVFNLKYFEEMKYEDMAEILNTSVGALKASYHHAVKKVEEYIKQKD